ncbi:MAG: hypothetical protein BZ138_00885 [Methanosphaera sp. rholeuAM270]|nr:MAG: hypothetical protein BZ138_00885 [Methanosphaera sp. rholeuAM270]
MTSTECIKKILEDEERIIKVDLLKNQDKKEILKLEMKRLDEMVPLINRGLEETLEEDNVLIVIKDKRDITLPDEELIPTLTLMSESGILIGEEVYDPEEYEELKEDPDVYFISEHFATYPSRSKPGEKQFFVVSQLRGELSCENEIEEKVSSLSIATPSTSVDHYIKDIYNMDYEDKIITLLVGFSLK